MVLNTVPKKLCNIFFRHEIAGLSVSLQAATRLVVSKYAIKCPFVTGSGNIFRGRPQLIVFPLSIEPCPTVEISPAAREDRDINFVRHL
jgi:hypothetical protein